MARSPVAVEVEGATALVGGTSVKNRGVKAMAAAVMVGEATEEASGVEAMATTMATVSAYI